MSSELTPYEKSILQRVIDRRNTVPEEPEQEEPQADSEEELGGDHNFRGVVSLK
jgi:hypothetical protein